MVEGGKPGVGAPDTNVGVFNDDCIAIGGFPNPERGGLDTSEEVGVIGVDF